MGFGFDFGPGSRGPRRTKGQDSNIPYEVTLEDLYNGKTVKMNMEKEVVCGVCKGCVRSMSHSPFCGPDWPCSTGAKGNAKPKPCVKCEGKGWTMVTTSVSPKLSTWSLAHVWFVVGRIKAWYAQSNVHRLRGARREAQGKGSVRQFTISFTAVAYIVCRCKKCKGNKTVKEKTRQEIYIERGMADRQRIVLAGAGDEEVRQHTL